MTGHGNAHSSLPVTSVSWNAAPGFRATPWAGLCFTALLSMIALLALWLGRDRAAAGLTLWNIANLTSLATGAVASDGMVGLGLVLGEWAIFLLARVGLYVMAESMAGAALSPRASPWWRAGFLLLLGLGRSLRSVGPLAFISPPDGRNCCGPVRLGRDGELSRSGGAAVRELSPRRGQPSGCGCAGCCGSGAMFVVGIALSNTQILAPRLH